MLTDLGLDLVRRIRRLERLLERLTVQEIPKNPLGCRVYRAVDQAGVPSGAWTTIVWDTETYDVGDCWNSDQPTRFVAPRDGYYCLSVQCLMLDANNTAGIRQVGLFDHNGNVIQTPLGRSYDPFFGLTSLWAYVGFWYMEKGDYLEAKIYQNSGTTKTMRGVSSGGSAANHASFWSID